ncbi:mucin-7 precursor [Ophiostoma piceae UAMH 11346]|uniref:Mucin-7 n=1 Tax=Ophiostoma piceae (strain UAMH 11346) TaxID=1262450 RepID=S3CA66_OPHP1|nr:mucin-7 precursor [Ophiostoma piceae UAMH 11346]
MSQVKNLRAMFEQRGPSSPPERGREGTPGQSESPRPLSRVRTNFVTVEKDGRVGLQRDTSSDSIPTLSRTMSAGTEGDVPTPTTSQAGAPEVKSMPEDARPLLVAQTPKRVSSVASEETAPVSPAKVATPLVAISKPALGATPKISVLAPAAALADAKPSAPAPVIVSKEKTANSDQKENKPASSDATPAEKSPVRKLFTKPFTKPIETSKATSDAPKKSPDALTNGAARLRTANAASKDKSDTPKAASTTATSSIPMRSKIPNAANAPKETTKTAPKATATAKSLPKAISTAKTTTKTSTKSTGLKVKTPTSPSKPLTPRLAASKPAADKKTTTSTVAEKKSTPAASAPKGAAGKKPPSIQTFPPNGIGFVKPKPKSPTRPVQLPSGLTTHTASSATKTRQSLSRQSGNFLAVHGASQASATRSLSRASVSSSTTLAKGLRRQSSTIGHQRPSIGPPPKQPARDHPITKKEKAVDESFLERMMRPTQSFASKTADKVHQSPPRSNRSRESFGSTWSTTSSTKPTKEKAVAIPKSVPADDTFVAPPSPVIVEPIQEVDTTTLHTEEHDPIIIVEEVKGEVEAEAEEKADATPSEFAEPTDLSVTEPEEAIETAESETEEATVHEEAQQAKEAVDEAHAEDGEAEDETVTEAIVEEETAEEAVEETAEVAAEEAVSDEEAAPVTETTVEETAEEEAVPEATPEVSIDAADVAAEPKKDITHIDVVEIKDLDAVVATKAATAEAPTTATDF